MSSPVSRSVPTRHRPAAGGRSAFPLAVGGSVLVVSMAAHFRVPVLPAIGRDLALSPATLGALTTVFGVGRLVADVPAGRLADRSTPAAAFAVAGVLLAAGSAVFATAGGLPAALAAVLLLGLASATSNTTGMAHFSGSAPRERRGSALALYSAALLGGQALGPTVAGFVADATSWRVAFAVAAALGLVVVVLAFLPDGDAGGTSHVTDLPTPLTIPRSDRWLLSAVPFVFFFVLAAVPQTLVPIIGEARYALSAGTIGLALGVGGLCRFAGAFAGGAVSDRVSRRAALLPGLVAVAAGVAILAASASVALWFVAIVVLSLASFPHSVAATMLADRVDPRALGRELGSFRFVGDLGLIAGPVVGGLLYERAGASTALLTIAALPALLAVVALVYLPEDPASPRTEHG